MKYGDCPRDLYATQTGGATDTPAICDDLMDKYYWDVVETNPTCVDSLVQQCKETSQYDDRLFCKSSIDLQCKPCMAYMHKSIPKHHKCYTELSQLCTNPEHKSTKFCIQHNNSSNRQSQDQSLLDQQDMATNTDAKERIWHKVFCKCNYIDNVNALVLRRIVWIITTMLVSLMIIVHFN